MVHRDLKPGNVLVQADGTPKVLDFGIARSADRAEADARGHTRAGQLIGTPAYTSPEQATLEDADIDGRSDVHALGVIGYELLARKPPHDLSGKGLHEVLRIVREQDAVPLGRVDPSLGGDPATILAKALEKEPERRYQSSAALADDIRRYLHDEPIAARPATAAYQLVEVARRNRGLTAALVGLALVLDLAAGAITLLWIKAEGARASPGETTP